MCHRRHGEKDTRMAPRIVAATPRASSDLQLYVDAVSVCHDLCGFMNEWLGRNAHLEWALVLFSRIASEVIAICPLRFCAEGGKFFGIVFFVHC